MAAIQADPVVPAVAALAEGQAPPPAAALVMGAPAMFNCDRPAALAQLHPRSFFNGPFPVGVDNYLFNTKNLLASLNGTAVPFLRSDPSFLSLLRARAAELTLGDQTEQGKDTPLGSEA